jgi:hemolysin activation/secretion protein
LRLAVKTAFALGLAAGVAAAAKADPVVGMSAYDPKDVQEWIAETAGQEADSEQQAAIIERLYHSDGFLAAEAVVAVDANGKRVILVHEGRLGAIHLEGGSEGAQRTVGRFLEPLADGTPLHISRLERQMLLAGDQGGLDVSASLDHPDPSADTRLNVIISQSRQSGSASLDLVPQRPGTIGRLVLDQSFYGVLEGGDVLRGLGVVSRAPSGDLGFAGRVSYRTAIGSHGVFGELFAGTALSDREFNNPRLRNEQRGRQFGVLVGYPIARSMEGSLFVAGEFEHSQGKFRVGPTETRSGVDAVRGYLIGAYSSPDGTQFEGSLRLSAGRRRDPDPGQLPDGDRTFASVRAEAGVVTPIANRLALRVETEGQLALSNLPEVEHFFLGHLPLVRGYAQSAVEADSGAAATIQVDQLVELSPETSLTVSGFSDFGFVRRRAGDPQYVVDEDIASFGLGAAIAHKSGISLTGWLAMPVLDSRLTDAGDPIVYLQLAKRW